MNFKVNVGQKLDQENPLNKAYRLFINELCIEPERLTSNSVLKINTKGDKDLIKIDDRHIYSKKKFLDSKSFRFNLEKYYNKNGYYVKKPHFIDDIIFLELTNMYFRPAT